MQTRIQRWGHSLALRIPKALATELGVGRDSLVDLTLHEGRLIVRPTRPPVVTLESLLAGITDENLHGEVETGMPMGNEAGADDVRARSW